MRLARQEHVLLDNPGYGKVWPPQVWIDSETGDEVVRPPQQEKYLYGNPELPIASRGDYIVDTIANHEVTVVVSHTGTGKSTFIPQALYESGLIKGRIYTTQPRIVAARENAQYIRSQMQESTGMDMSHVVGYQTATEGDRQPENVIIEETDGLVLAQMMREGTITKDDVVLVDEAHERNANIDLTIAVTHKFGIRLVILSATIDGQRAARHAAQARGLDAKDVPLLEIPGRPHPIEDKEGGVITDEIIKYAQDHKNILVFVPGARETSAITGKIIRRLPRGYAVLTLNGDQTLEEQQRCFANYPDGKVVISTSVGQTSITVPDIDVVIDSQWERMGDYRQGIRSLRVRPVSQATSIQRKGRAGRTKPGIYVRAQLDGYPPIEKDINGNPIVERYDIPSILRTDLSSIALRLTGADLTLEQLDLPDMPKSSEIDYAHHKLVRLGSQALNSSAVTEIGDQMRDISLDAHYARMLVESRRFSTDVQLQMAAMLAVCQYESITMTEKYQENWRNLTRENRSDMLVQLDVFIKSIHMSSAQLQAYNIIEQRQIKALQKFKQLCEDSGLDIDELNLPNEEERRLLIGCIIAGSNKLFVSNRVGTYTDEAGFTGRLPMSTEIPSVARLIAGTPFELEHMRNSGVKSHNLVLNGTAVTAEQLEEFTPWRCSYNNESTTVDKNGHAIVARDLYYDGRPTKQISYVEAEASRETLNVLLSKLFKERQRFDNMSRSATLLYDEVDKLHTYLVDYSDNKKQYDEIVNNIISTVELWKDLKSNDINDLAKILEKRSIYKQLENTVPVDGWEAESIRDTAPQTVAYDADGGIHTTDVTYKNNEAYLTIGSNHVKYLRDIADQLNGRAVHVQVASNRYETMEEALEHYTGVNRATRRSRSRKSRK